MDILLENPNPQIFRCENCGNQVIAADYNECDILEHSICESCREGHMEWYGPWQLHNEEER